MRKINILYLFYKITWKFFLEAQDRLEMENYAEKIQDNIYISQLKMIKLVLWYVSSLMEDLGSMHLLIYHLLTYLRASTNYVHASGGRGYLSKCKFVGTCQNSLEQNLAGAVLTNFCTKRFWQVLSLKEWTLGRVFKLCVSTFFIQICLRNQLNFWMEKMPNKFLNFILKDN